MSRDPSEGFTEPGDQAAREANELLPELDAATQEKLGKVLARYSNELVSQPVPDIFLSLLAKLAAKERGE
jgi:hypothetical protein